MGDRKYFIKKGISFLETLGTIIAESSLYETTPIGMDKSANNFINSVVALESKIEPEKLLTKIKHFESSMGRDTKKSHMMSRRIDIDIVFVENRIINTFTLKVPHPEAVNREFVLEPLAEIFPEYIHPVYGIQISELLRKLKRDKNAKSEKEHP